MKNKTLAIAAFLTAVPGFMILSAPTASAAPPTERKTCEDYPLANPLLPTDKCRDDHGGKYTS